MSLLCCLPMTLAAISPALLLVINEATLRLGALASLALAGGAGALCWLAAVLLVRHPFHEELRLLVRAALRSGRQLIKRA